MRLCVPWVKESIARFEVRSRAKKPHGATKWREPVFVSANQDQTALRVVRLHERFSPLEQVYRRYGRYVAAVILRLEGRQAEVEDLVQEVFLEATRGIDGLGGGNTTPAPAC
jgi:hypothetical protein